MKRRLDNISHFYVYLLAFVLTLVGVRAEASVVEHSPGYLVRSLGLDRGLSSNYVVDIVQDRNGFLWFATEEGLNRFDGTQFSSFYKKTNGRGLTGNDLSRLLADETEPVVWIGTQRNGLNSYNYLTGQFAHYTHDPKNRHSIVTNDVTDLAQARDGGIWVATYWRGIDHMNKQTGRFTHYNQSNVAHLASNQNWCVIDAGGDQLYVGHVGAGLSIVNTRTRTARNYRHIAAQPSSLSGNNVYCLFQDRSGHVWVGTDEGLDLFDPINDAFVHIDGPGLRGHRVYAIIELSDGRICVGAEFGGVSIISQAHASSGARFTVTRYITEGTLATNLTGSTIRTLLQDQYNNVWVGLYGSGVNFITRQLPTIGKIVYSIYGEDSYLTNKTVFGLGADDAGNLWLGTDGSGINVFSPARRRIAVYPTQAGYCVQAIRRDSRGTMWFGSYGEGAWVKSAAGGFARVGGLPPTADVRAFYEDSSHRMWMATDTGIYVADVATHRVTAVYNYKLKLVRTISADRRGRLWVGTFADGVRVYSPQMKLLRSFTVDDGFPSNDVSHIIRDHEGRMWAATANGMVRFDNGDRWTYRLYDQSNGLNNLHVRALAEDRRGNIWASTNKGISCLQQGDSTFINFTYKDNLPQGNFNDAGVTTLADGTLVFGSTEGVAFFHPDQLLARREPPRVIVTEAVLPPQTDNGADSIVSLIGTDHLRLSSGETTFRVRFGIQNYALSDHVEYAYMLKGRNSSWVTAAINEVTLRDVPYGSHELRVRCRLRNQPWADTYTTFIVEVAPPFWLSTWAKLLYVLMGVGLVLVVFRFYNRKMKLEYLYESEKKRHEQEQELNSERLSFFTNITHELRTPLTLILGPLDDISRQQGLPADTQRKLSVIRSSAQRLNRLVNQILEFRKTETENRSLSVARADIVACVAEVCDKYRELSAKKNVKISFESDEAPIEIYFDREVITIVVDNLVSNAVKYTDRGEVTISVRRKREFTHHYVEIVVTDTGHGISAQALPHVFDSYYQEKGPHQASGTGIGLALTKSLVDLHEGTITVESSVERGSKFCVVLDADNIYPNSLHHEGDVPEPPAVSEEEQTESPLDAMESQEDEKPMVLVVEDNKDIRDYIADSLSAHYDVRTADNGRDGLGMALDTIPDIVITDVMMPLMDGNEMCRRLKADVRTSHIPVVMLTAKDAISAVEEGYEAGADSYLTKPFTASLLEVRVRNLISQRRLLLHRAADTIQTAEAADVADEQKRRRMRDALNEIDREFYDKVDHLIEARISGEVDVNYLADNLNMSASTLYRKMRAMTGLSTNEYVRQYKMHYAERLLLEGKNSISEISYMVGISSVAYFRKSFKDEFGMIPSEYVKKYSNA